MICWRLLPRSGVVSISKHTSCTCSEITRVILRAKKTLMFPSGSEVYLQQGWPVPIFKALFAWQDSEGV